jgi:GntR family transcriptional regulator, vanillate catabolism transcriptional regulator
VEALTAGRPGHFDSVTLQLREWVLSGEFPGGIKLREAQLAERLGVSRTPVRLALGILAREGLLDHEPHRGFSVREITPDQIYAAFDVRGALEALAARLVAARGLSQQQTLELNDCLATGEALLQRGSFDDADPSGWSSMNERLHSSIVRAANSRPLVDAIAFNARLPLVSPGAIAFCQGQLELSFALMQQAQREHLDIVDSLQKRQIDRAHALMTEHTYKSRENLKQLLASARTMRGLHIAMQRLRRVAVDSSA